MYSTDHRIHRNNWTADYFTKRFWQIAPLFYFVMGMFGFRLMSYLAANGRIMKRLIPITVLLFTDRLIEV